MNLGSYKNRILRINLSNRTISEQGLSDEVIHSFIGGRGFGIYQLYRELKPKIEPLSEQNKLIFVTGVFTGTSAQAASRWMVFAKSPLTGYVARSVAGGDWGAWLKFAGYDFIQVEGKAERPVYLYITPEGCQILDAGELWGKGTRETQEIISGIHGKNTRVACIGPAGERLVRYAAIMTKERAAGRCGVGTVMGSKNLKAIAVNATRNISVYDSEAYAQLVKEQIATFNNNKTCLHHKAMGTTDTQDITNSFGIFPTRNFRYGVLTNWKKMSGEEYQKYKIGNEGCYSCFVRCGHVHQVADGAYPGARSGGTEYETICMFTGSIESNNVEATIAANQLCNDLGLDTISTGSCIGFAYELYERGIISRQDTDGLELTYGNHAAMIEMVKKIAFREGIGNILAEGTKRAAQIIGKGSESFAMHIKGMEISGYEPRGAKSQGFNMATSNIGASHNYGYAVQEIFGVPFPRIVDRFAEEENADIVIHNQDTKGLLEVGIGCEFSQGWAWFPNLFSRMLVAATGIKEFGDVGYSMKAGERIVNLERLFNVREGLKREDDYLPRRMLEEPLDTRGAPGNGQVVKYMDKFLDRYYQLRGWTSGGRPSRQKVEELGLFKLMPGLKSLVS